MFFTNNLSAQYPQEEYLNENIETHQYDRDQWEALVEGVDFSEVQKKKKKRKKKKRNLEDRDTPAFDSGSGGISQILMIVFIVIGIAVLVFLLLKVAGNENLFGPRDKKIKQQGVNLQKIEDNLPEAELADPISQAIADGKYNIAIRLYYLSILKELALKKIIRWKKEKTNGEYVRELAGTSFFKNMQEITLIFERIWYGKAAFGQADFLAVQPKFLETINAAKTVSSQRPGPTVKGNGQ